MPMRRDVQMGVSLSVVTQGQATEENEDLLGSQKGICFMVLLVQFHSITSGTHAGVQEEHCYHQSGEI
jgi:hypothetical protein